MSHVQDRRSAPVDFSLVIPVFNEAGNIEPLLEEITEAFSDLSCEIIVIDDASDDGGAVGIERRPGVRLLSHARRTGKSRALVTGFGAARGRWVITLDGDGQNDPKDLAAIARAYGARTPAFIVAGVRRRRNDGAVKWLTSKAANRIRGWFLRDMSRDTGCGVKMMPRALTERLPYFDNMHRFLPALARRAGFDVIEHEIDDRPRQHGVSKFGFFDRAAVALLDLIGVYWLIRRYADPGAIRERESGADASDGPAEPTETAASASRTPGS